MAMLSLPLGPTEAPWGVNFGLTLRSRMPVSTGRSISSASLTLLPFIRPRESWCMVRVTARCLQCILVAAHAPHSGVDVAARSFWWDDLSRRLAGQLDVVLFVDANARLGSSVSASVGSGGVCQQEDLSGAMFHRTLVELGLCFPATFGPVDLSAFTWIANGGASHRIDYVAVPCTWDCGARERSCHMVAPRKARDIADSCSVHVVDSAGDWEDHFLVALPALVVIRWAPRSTQWRVEGVDRAALKDPVYCCKFTSALRAIKPPPWAMSVDEHERYAAGAVCKAAKAAFGAPARRPRREHIDCAAWALTCDRRIVKIWCRERRVSAPTRSILPGRTPGPLWVFMGVHVTMWASGRGSSASLASLVFSELTAQVTPLVEGAWAFLRHSGGVLKGHRKAASAAFLGAIACALDAAQADRARDLAWRKLRSLTCRGGAKWKGAKSLPGRVDEDGVAATTTQEVSGAVLRHFAAIEAAEVCSVEALAGRHGRSRSALALGALRDINNVRDLVTLRRLFARSKRGKACGIDGVRDDFCAIAPV